MAKSESPSDETQRNGFFSIGSYGIEESGSKPPFDFIAEAAATLCGQPIAILLLEDGVEECLVAFHGLDLRHVDEILSGLRLEDDPTKTAPAGFDQDVRIPEKQFVAAGRTVHLTGGIRISKADGAPLGWLGIFGEHRKEISVPQWRSLELLGAYAETVLELRRLRNEVEELLRIGNSLAEVTGPFAWSLDLAKGLGMAVPTLLDRFSGTEHAELSIHPDDLDQVQARAETSNLTGATYEAEFRARRDATGEWRWHLLRGAATREAEEGSFRITGIMLDVTDRKSAELSHIHDLYRLRNLIDNMPALIGYWREDCTNEFANSLYREWLGIHEGTAGVQLRHILGDALYEQARPHIEAVLQGVPQLFDRTLVDPSGGVRHCQISYVPDIQEGVMRGFFSLTTDITARKVAEMALAETEERMRITLSSIGDAVIATDDRGHVTFLNPVAEYMTGWSLSEALERPIEEVMDFRDATSRTPMINPLRVAIGEKRSVGMAHNCILLCRTGGEHGIEDSAAPIWDVNRRLVGAVIVFHDVSEARAMAIKMSHLAQHDALTDLPNRVLLRDRLDQALARSLRQGNRFALFFLDLDHFKNVNDTYGHLAGDELLRAVAKRLQSAVRLGDTVCRQSGDEFIVLMPDIQSAAQAAESLARLLVAMGTPYEIEVNESVRKFNMTFSVGIAIYPDDGDNGESLLQRADAAMYLAKKSGRNQYHFCSREIEEALLAKQTMLEAMRVALDQGDFSVAYQPLVESHSHRLKGVEALARWQTPQGDWVPPNDFIPLAEESGLILELGRFVLQTACRQCRQWMDEGFGEVPVSVNISPAQFSTVSFLSLIVDTLKETGVDPGLLCLEITETALIQNAKIAREVLQSIRLLGVRISLDDFGTGYSSLIHLVQLPLDELKIDQSFIAGIEIGAANEAIVRSICGLAQALKLNVVAEGIETAAQLHKLEGLSCDTLQGYLFSRPVAAAMIPKFADQADGTLSPRERSAKPARISSMNGTPLLNDRTAKSFGAPR